MQYGFVMDHTRCIGCHACTVACKAENDVPVASFRTWVKYAEKGRFPAVNVLSSVSRLAHHVWTAEQATLVSTASSDLGGRRCSSPNDPKLPLDEKSQR